MLALQALTFLADVPDRLQRFLALTGLEPADLMSRAEANDVQIAVLQHLMGNESELLVFAAEQRVKPEMIALAHHRLTMGS